jgi:hypothetical protein
LFERATLSAKLRPGPLGVDLTLAQSSELRVAETRADALLRGGLSARVGLPLARDFGALRHFVEPVAVGRVLLDAAPRGAELNDTRTVLGAVGFDTALGRGSTREAGTLAVRSGVLNRAGGTELIGMTRAVVDARWLGLAHSLALVGTGTEPSLLSLSRVRLGPADSLHLRLRADGASAGSPARARVLFDETWFDPARPYLDRNGWSAGSELTVPWSRTLSTTGAVDYDLTSRELLAAWGGLGYRHPCGCLALASFVGHRVGRGGFDAWLGFDLAP